MGDMTELYEERLCFEAAQDAYSGTQPGRMRCGAQSTTGPVFWRDATGRQLDVRDIDKEYALNILTMVLLRRSKAGISSDELRGDGLVQALRETVLNGREPNEQDRARARLYNKRNQKAGLRFRAPVEDPRAEYPASEVRFVVDSDGKIDVKGQIATYEHFYEKYGPPEIG